MVFCLGLKQQLIRSNEDFSSSRDTVPSIPEGVKCRQSARNWSLVLHLSSSFLMVGQRSSSIAFLQSEVSLIVPDFTISLLGSSCNSLNFSLILHSFHCLSTFWQSILPWGCYLIEKESKGTTIGPKKR